MKHLTFYFSDIARLMRKRFDAERADGLTGAQWRLLAAVVEEPGLNQGQLAERLEVEPITVCRLIDRMEQASLVERRADPTDRRARRLYPAGDAAAHLKRLEVHGTRLVDRMTRGLVDADRAHLAGLLAQIRDNLLDDTLFGTQETHHG